MRRGLLGCVCWLPLHVLRQRMLLRCVSGRRARCSARRGGHRRIRMWRRPATSGRRRTGVVRSWRFVVGVVGMAWRGVEERVHRIDYHRHSSSSVDSGADVCREASQYVQVLGRATWLSAN
jgi:hypothetical protein